MQAFLQRMAEAWALLRRAPALREVAQATNLTTYHLSMLIWLLSTS
jgi:hypothetical protein